MTEKSIAQVYASASFRRLMEEGRDRLARAAALREQMQRQIEAGLTPTGLYAELVDRMSRDIIQLLCAAAEKFNAEHEDLMCSTAAFLDALATARKRLLEGVAMMRSATPAEEDRADG